MKLIDNKRFDSIDKKKNGNLTENSVTLIRHLIKNEIFIELLIIYKTFDTSSKKPLKE